MIHCFKAALILLLLATSAQMARSEDDTVTVVNGVTRTLGTFIDSGKNNLLIVTNAGRVSLTNIAASASAIGNKVIIAGTNSLVAVTGGATPRLTVGQNGSLNELRFEDGGGLQNNTGNLIIGSPTSTGSGNLIHFERTRITGGSLLISGGSGQRIVARDSFLSMGTTMDGVSGVLDVASSTWNGGVTMTGSLGRATFRENSMVAGRILIRGFNNKVECIGPGTVVTHTLGFTNGAGGGFNTFVLSDGAVMTNNSGFNVGVNSSGNRAIVTGAETKLTMGSGVAVGFGGDGNGLEILDGARVLAGGVTVGAAGANNFALVSGPGSRFELTSLMVTGHVNSFQVDNRATATGTVAVVAGASNALAVTRGGDFQLSGDLRVAFGGRLQVDGGALSTQSTILTNGSNYLEIAGVGGSWANRGSLRMVSDSNVVAVANGGAFESGSVEMGRLANDVPLALSNRFMVGDLGSLATVTNLVFVTEKQQLMVSNGGRLLTREFAASRGGADLQVSGPGSSWRHVSNLTIGRAKTPDSLKISGGGQFTNLNLTVGDGTHISLLAPPLISEAGVIVSGVGTAASIQSNLVVGLEAASNRVAILDGATVIAENVIIGRTEVSSAGDRNNFKGGFNEIRVDGPAASLLVKSNLWLGYRSTSNRLVVARGGFVSAGTVDASIYRGTDTISRNLRNAITIQDPGSKVWVTSPEFFFVDGMDVLDGAEFKAGGESLVGTLRIGGDGTVARMERGLEVYYELVIERGGRLNAPSITVGDFGAKRIHLANAGSILETERMDLFAYFPIPTPFTPDLEFVIRDGATLRSGIVNLGASNQELAGGIYVDRGNVDISLPDGRGVLNIENGELGITNATVMTDSAWFGAGPVGGARLIIGENAVLRARRSLRIGATNTLDALLSGPGSEGLIRVGVDGAVLGGAFVFRFTSGHAFQSGDSIRLVAAQTVTGGFQGAAHGSRIRDVGNTGSFAIQYEETGVWLRDFRPGAAEIKVEAALDLAAGTMRLTFPAASGGGATLVEASRDLAEWQVLSDLLFENNGAIRSCVLPVDVAKEARFFRLREN